MVTLQQIILYNRYLKMMGYAPPQGDLSKVFLSVHRLEYFVHKLEVEKALTAPEHEPLAKAALNGVEIRLGIEQLPHPVIVPEPPWNEISITAI